jgi:hypothetical protein
LLSFQTNGAQKFILSFRLKLEVWGRIHPAQTSSQSPAFFPRSRVDEAAVIKHAAKISPRQQLHSVPLLLVEMTG